METVVISFLLVTGALCILAQAIVTVYRQREAAATSVALLEKSQAKSAPKPRAKASTAKTTAAKTSAAKSTASKTSAEPDPADSDNSGDEEATPTTRMLATVAGVLGERTPAGAQLGLLGVGLMLIAVVMVLDVSIAFSINT
ncbi:hypothetical protein [Demequina flava]|uniref:hypothetical protein n=1 Tax=Demequina flava TaxID=1095025 RepID=UPI0007840CD3|nr:hypothetical protein [Demequina flava]